MGLPIPPPPALLALIESLTAAADRAWRPGWNGEDAVECILAEIEARGDGWGIPPAIHDRCRAAVCLGAAQVSTAHIVRIVLGVIWDECGPLPIAGASA